MVFYCFSTYYFVNISIKRFFFIALSIISVLFFDSAKRNSLNSVHLTKNTNCLRLMDSYLQKKASVFCTWMPCNQASSMHNNFKRGYPLIKYNYFELFCQGPSAFNLRKDELERPFRLYICKLQLSIWSLLLNHV